MRRTLRRLRDLPIHVFMSAHAQQREEPRLGRVTIPELTGQLAEEIAGLVSVSAYLGLTADEDGNTERILLLHDHPRYRVKVRTQWRQTVPTEILNPDITEILDVFGFEN